METNEEVEEGEYQSEEKHERANVFHDPTGKSAETTQINR